MNWNQCQIGGNLTRDPELKYTPKGTAVCKIGVAVNRRWKTESGEQKEEVDFIDAEAWGKTAEIISQHLKKGQPIFFAGRLKLDSWEDKNTRQKVNKLKVVLEQFQFVGGKQDGQSSGQSSSYSQPQSSAPSTPPPSAPASEPDMPPAETDDVPF